MSLTSTEAAYTLPESPLSRSQVKVRTRILKISAIAFFLLSLAYAFGYAKSMVNFKYEVEHSENSSGQFIGLSHHQQAIVHAVYYYPVKSAFYLLACLFFYAWGNFKPKLNGKLAYAK